MGDSLRRLRPGWSNQVRAYSKSSTRSVCYRVYIDWIYPAQTEPAQQVLPCIRSQIIVSD